MNRILLPLLLAAIMTGTGCFGSFTAVRKAYNFNETVHSDKFVKWGVYLVMSVSVYPLAVFADALVLNSLEFWTGSNPMAEGDTYQETDVQGNSVQATRLPDGRLHMTITTAQGQSNTLVLQKTAEELVILDNNYEVLTREAYPTEFAKVD